MSGHATEPSPAEAGDGEQGGGLVRLRPGEGNPRVWSYVAAGVVYVALGVWNQNWLYSFVVGASFLVVAVVLLPALVRRLLR